MITGKTKNLGVIGWPIAHSLSPVLQNAALTAAGLDYAYIALPTAPSELATAVQGLCALNFRGFNVTIPHKAAIMEFLDKIDEAATVIGAVNTVVNDAGRLTGYNTDACGFSGALLAAGFKPGNCQAAILGAGGAARAVIWGLIEQKATRISLGVRNAGKAAPLAELFRPYIDIAVFPWDSEAFRARLATADLLVNTTPLGMAPRTAEKPLISWAALKPTAFVYDIIYTPAETLFLREAKEQGHATLNGEGMLVGQGAAAFKLWTGQEADQGVMRQALHDFLHGAGK